MKWMLCLVVAVLFFASVAEAGSGRLRSQAQCGNGSFSAGFRAGQRAAARQQQKEFNRGFDAGVLAQRQRQFHHR